MLTLVFQGVGETGVNSYTVEEKTFADELTGYELEISFNETKKPTLNISYHCEGLQHFNLFKSKKVTAHVYTINLVLLSQQVVPSRLVQANVHFPFNVSDADIVSVSIPTITRSQNGSVVHFEGLNVNTFSLAFAFDFSVYDEACGTGRELFDFCRR